MRLDFGRIFTLAFVALFLTACKTVTVEQPEEDSVHTTAPDVVLTFPNGRPDTLEITLNGQDITAQFAVTDSGATANGSSIASALVDGKNSLKVVNPNTPLRSFIFDQSGPTVHILNVTEGGSIGISGYVEDPSGVQSVTVNGSAVTLGEGNTFAVSVANGDFVEFVSTDTNGFVRTQKFARPNVAMSDVMSLRVARSGLDFAIAEIEELLTSDSLGDLIAGVNPIADDSILGNDYEVNVEDATIGSAELSMSITGTNGNLSLSGHMYDIVADFSIFIDYIWPLGTGTIDGSFFLDHAGFSANANVTANNGNVNVAVDVTDLDLDAIRSDINNFPDWLLVPIYEVFEWLFELIIKGQVEDMAEEKLGEFLNTFPDSIVLDIDGNQIKPLVSPESVTSPSNGLNIGLGAHIYALTENGPNQVGSAYSDAGAMPTPTTTAPGDEERDIGLVLAENTINQALAAVVESGILNISMTTAELPGIGDVDPAAANIRVRVIPTSAPTIDLISGQEAGLGRLDFRDFYVAFDVIPSGGSEFELFLGATLDIGAAADLGITDENAIAIDFVGLPAITIRDLDENGSIALDEGLAQALFDEFIPAVLPPVMNAIGAIPLPSFAGYGVNVGSLWVMDSAGDYVGLTADLVKASTTAAAAAPATYASLSTAARASSFSLTGGAAVDGEKVVISVGGSEEGMSSKYSVDGGPFGLWKQRDEITLYNLRSGDHTVTVCARSAALVEDPDCATVEFEVE